MGVIPEILVLISIMYHLLSEKTKSTCAIPDKFNSFAKFFNICFNFFILYFFSKIGPIFTLCFGLVIPYLFTENRYGL